MKSYGDKINTNFPELNVSEYDIECESFKVISVDSSLVLFTCIRKQILPADIFRQLSL